MGKNLLTLRVNNNNVISSAARMTFIQIPHRSFNSSEDTFDLLGSLHVLLWIISPLTLQRALTYQDIVTAIWNVFLYTNKDSEGLKQNFSTVFKEGISPNFRKRMWNKLIPLEWKVLRIMTSIAWTLTDKKRRINREKRVFYIIQNKTVSLGFLPYPKPVCRIKKSNYVMWETISKYL